MRPATKPVSAKRSGKVVLLFALLLPAVFGMVAITAEGGLLLDQRRRAQAAADSAAMAAAVRLYNTYISKEGYDDSNETAKKIARAAAETAGFKHDGKRTVVDPQIPPKSGDHINEPGYAEVTITYNQPRLFSRLFGLSDLPVRARSVARGRWVSLKAGILILDLTEAEALKANGGGTVTVKNSDIIVNSKDPSAVGGDGGGAWLEVVNGQFDLTGGVKSNTTLHGPVLYNQLPTPDPLAYLPPPALPQAVLTANGQSPNASGLQNYLKALNLKVKDINGKVYVLEPGRYDRMPNFSNGDVVILKQASANTNGGIYYLNGSGFTSTGATIVMDPTGATSGGVMFYNNPTKQSDGINITGGKIVLEPPATGAYKGMLIFQNRTADVDLQITGQGGMQISGTFYAAKALLKITGSSATTVDVIGSQYISRLLQSGGNGKYMVDWQADKTARIRQIGLTE